MSTLFCWYEPKWLLQSFSRVYRSVLNAQILKSGMLPYPQCRHCEHSLDVSDNVPCATTMQSINDLVTHWRRGDKEGLEYQWTSQPVQYRTRGTHNSRTR